MQYESSKQFDKFGLRTRGDGQAICVLISVYRTGTGGCVRSVVLGHRQYLVVEREKNTDGVGGRPRPPSPRHR